ncbi:hypothetical protein DFO70_117102 [Cytobacillus firmus]|uniref:Uncharacterized protein n=2 Tax=Cytobacillus TaxID=2675230 RepID=A0A366JLN3_CYTFI|nr:hypothetical protein DFO70_117102 [Cytobacillus firmus]TDX39274.1 hypothetical protein DFO72_111104 [Cytobacillus oceanisediminis]
MIKHPDLKNQFYLEFNFYNLLLLDKYEELQKLLFSKVVPALEMEKNIFPYLITVCFWGSTIMLMNNIKMLLNILRIQENFLINQT